MAKKHYYAISGISFEKTPNNPNFIDMTGFEFGRLLVLGFAGSKNNHKKWYCSCVCNRDKAFIVDGSILRQGKTKSCGCLSGEMKSQRSRRHGMKGTPEYRSYSKAKSRCQNPNATQYEDWGGRGIKFLFGSFEDFYKEVGDRPSQSHSIGRIDNSGNYEPGNVRWEDKESQSNNKRNNIFITISGETKTLKQWMRGFSKGRYLHARKKIKDLGFDPVQVVLQYLAPLNK
jgi:hypothetical protein